LSPIKNALRLLEMIPQSWYWNY